MRQYAEVTMPARVEKQCVSKQCDLCHASFPGGGWPDEAWANKPWEVSETAVSYRDGTRDVDGGSSGTEISVDVCPECFKKKLVPWLASQGANVEEKSYCY